LIREESSKLKIEACVKVISITLKWINQRVDFFLLSKSASIEVLNEIATQIIPENAHPLLIELADELSNRLGQ